MSGERTELETLGLIAEALRLLRTRRGLTQTAAGRLDGAPDFRTLSHWETRRKQPSLRLLTGYLDALGFDYHDLQDALDQVGALGTTAGQIDELGGQVDRLARAVEDIVERRMVVLERRLELGVRCLTERVDGIEREDPEAPTKTATLGDRDLRLAAELERLAERLAAVERQMVP